MSLTIRTAVEVDLVRQVELEALVTPANRVGERGISERPARSRETVLVAADSNGAVFAVLYTVRASEAMAATLGEGGATYATVADYSAGVDAGPRVSAGLSEGVGDGNGERVDDVAAEGEGTVSVWAYIVVEPGKRHLIDTVHREARGYCVGELGCRRVLVPTLELLEHNSQPALLNKQTTCSRTCSPSRRRRWGSRSGLSAGPSGSAAAAAATRRRPRRRRRARSLSPPPGSAWRHFALLS